ncbi:hypothetical protein SAMN04488498_105209 [Mesorhizobium albiziae]|uniref:DUF2059 domain-containing protein n=1 Tax=Neomesorhizobium albiziae TaxID=335020 RepID=A0A1I3YXU1_9HYPH|nr:DUF2059 domain-containing protein [Mesorhizobium albiziae]GLS33243.1 hypothetical protein GCM10007937_49540 [Mesorhizobium albiziae]SFK36031.1 hypothetical protein SAMN04488498_105209 [Mesorhizobium albiziae]
MTFAKRARRITISLAAVVSLLSGAAFAQDISDSHLKACRAAVDAINATDQYDGILPTAAQALKTQLIQKNPDLQDLIVKTVDEQTIKMVSRRGDLEREAGLAYARVFKEEQCSEIAAFYQSETGLKLLSDGPIVTRELIKAANIWQNGVARDLAQAVGESLTATLKNAAPLELPAQDGSQATPPIAPVDGAAPGTEAPAPAEGTSN